jgi:hypothetical protein
MFGNETVKKRQTLGLRPFKGGQGHGGLASV